ncbi:MAG: cobyrinate a,c-diamide synthase [Betaproteobacteria bacterium]|nr:MAG: cobyrinate a,c-diamide synthase [Betaproteobacteria bacterium]
MHRFLVSAAHKSSGKTAVSVGLAAELSRRGLVVQAFKKGPDYIDPMWLAAATGRPCRNLDFNLSAPDELRLEFARHGALADVCLVEGNKGLYDGLDLHGNNSNAALARLLDLPVVLVLDARGMTRGIAPLILGYQAFDRSIRIAGVILSRLGGARHEAKLRAVIEHYTDVPVLGAMHEDPRLAIAERHIGLTPTNEDGAAQARIAALAAAVAGQVDIERLLAATVSSAPLPAALPLARPARLSVRIPQGLPVVVGIARDRAFGFYYPDDLEALERAGAELLFFDTLRDARLPRVDGLIIGGGFPEIFMRELEANAALRGEILAAIRAGMPAYAECGGLMYLARSLSWRGDTRRMVGAIPGDVVMHGQPMGRGYVRLAPTEAHPWRDRGEEQLEIPAHEFHYSSIEGLAPGTRFAYRVARGFGVDGKSDGIVVNNLLAAYSHLRGSGSCDWPARFVAFVRRRAEERNAAPALLSAVY